MNKAFSARVIKVLLLTSFLFLLTGCEKESTTLAFSFHTSSPYDSSEEKVIYFNENYEHVVLDVSLQIDTGSATLQVTDLHNQVIWNNTYEKDKNCKIELNSVIANEQYILSVQTEQAQNVNIQISSSVKLVQDKENPKQNF